MRSQFCLLEVTHSVKKRIKEKGLDEFEKALALIKNTIDRKKLSDKETAGLLKIITDYANSWVLLQRYDEDKLEITVPGAPGAPGRVPPAPPVTP